MLSHRFIARVLTAVAVVVPVTVAVALASTGEADPPAPGPVPRAEAMEGAFSNSSRAGEAVFRASGLKPGATTDGTVLVTNEGTSRGLFWLSRTGFSDRQGPAGGTLSERLQVTVLDVTARDAPMLVYTGGLTEMGARPLGFVAPGRSRIYSVAATLLPDTVSRVSAAGNPYEGSSTTISLGWGAIAGEPPAVRGTARPRASKADERPPRLRLAFPPRQRLLDAGRLVVNARCDQACRLHAAGSLRADGAPRSAATAARHAKPGQVAALRVTFGPAARQVIREALLGGRSVPIRLAVRARDRAGNETVTTRKIWLRPSH